jgi:hypothetical protein
MSATNKEISGKMQYPETTSGSKAAKKLRSETNGLKDGERERLMQAGVQIIYGGNGKKTVDSRH